MLTGDPYAQYKSQSLATLAPGEVLVKLFDECIKQMRLASIGINQRNFAATNDSLTKTQAILTTLASSLDMRYPIAGELKPMYIFLAQQLLKANLKKDSHMIDECISLIKDLREAFSQAEKISRQKHHAVMGGEIRRMNATQAPQHRNKSVIVQNMFDLTCEMIGHLEDYEFLVDAIDRRQVLMDEFDRVKNSPDFLSGMDGTRTAEVSNMLSNMRDMDKTVIQALSRILLEAKKELAANNNQQKVMGYMNNMVSSSGSYMNYSR